MPCYVKDTPNGRRFLCGEFGPHCRASGCGDVSDNLCDYPVGDGKTCDMPLCEVHSHEVAPNLHYCPAHSAEWKAFRNAGGVHRDLGNVVPFKTAPSPSEEQVESQFQAHCAAMSYDG